MTEPRVPAYAGLPVQQGFKFGRQYARGDKGCQDHSQLDQIAKCEHIGVQPYEYGLQPLLHTVRIKKFA